MCIAYNSFIYLFFQGLQTNPGKKGNIYIYIFILKPNCACACWIDFVIHWIIPKVALHFYGNLLLSWQSQQCVLFVWFSRFYLLPLWTDLFTWLLLLLLLICSVCSQHYIQLPVKHWPLVYIVLCFNCVSWKKMLINCDTLWEMLSLVNLLQRWMVVSAALTEMM